MQNSRRNFLKAAALVPAIYALKPGELLAAADCAGKGAIPKAISFDECQSMDPVKCAESSPMVQDAWKYLHAEHDGIKNPALRGLIKDTYADPAPALASRLDEKSRQAVWEELSAKGYTKDGQADFLPSTGSGKFSFLAAPGSGYQSHHAYPGGLCTHTATNVRITANIADTYREVFGYCVNRDIAVAAQFLHDLHKPWVFQWQADFSSRTEKPLAATGQHHPLSVAELLVRKAPAELAVAQACAHTHPGTPEDEAQVVNWLTAAAIIAGVDPVAYGLLEKGGKTLPLPRRQEGFLCHLGDHDFVLSVPAVQWTLPVMTEIAMADYRLSEADAKGKPFNALRNAVYSRVSAMRLHDAYAKEGKAGVRGLMLATVTPPKA